MRNLLLTLMLALCFYGAGQPIADGSQAPDFSTTDINGNPVVLSDILASGKTVLMDISATWCGPCWNLHQSHALKNIYYAFGDGGSGELKILFVEGDSSTTSADLNGTGSSTQGDWVTGTPYTIVDDGSITGQYFGSTAYFPTLFRICTSGMVYTVPSSSSPASIMNNMNACSTFEGVDNHAQIEMEDFSAMRTIQLCDFDDVNFSVKFKNFGTNNITTATLVLKENGTQVSTADYTGNVAQFQLSGDVEFSAIDVNTDSDYTVEFLTINGQTPFNPTLGSEIVNFEAPNTADNEIEVHIFTDNYPGEISWRLLDSAGEEVAAGGPYEEGPGGAGAGGPDANTTKIHAVTLPESLDCYTIELNDSYGDGWGYGSTNHGVAIFSEGEMVYQELVSNFGGQIVFGNAFSAENNMSVNDLTSAQKIQVYPNPSHGIVNVKAQNSFDATVYDANGKVVFNKKANDANSELNLEKLNQGVYFLNVVSGKETLTEKLIIK